MGATIILGEGAINGGSILLDGLLSTLYYADSLAVDTDTQTAVAQTQEEDGFDGKVTFQGTFSDSSTGTITGLSIEYSGVEEFSVTGLGIDLGTMKTAIETADQDEIGQGPGIQPLVDVFQGIDWTIDASGGKKHVLASGTGGDDHFTLTKFDDILMRDGGNDTVDMGAGNDTVLFTNFYGFNSDHGGHAVIDGGAGKDTLAFHFAGNDLTQDQPVDIDAQASLKFDLQKGTLSVKGDDEFPSNDYISFENAVGSSEADTLLGSKGGNSLDGSAGDDEITGRGGKDILTGGGGSDDFDFLTPSDSKAGKNRDIITDFEHKLDDVDLSKIDPDTKNHKFTFVDQNDLKHVGDLHFVLNDEKGKAHDTTLIEANLKGDAKPEIQIELTGLIHLDKGDFFL